MSRALVVSFFGVVSVLTPTINTLKYVRAFQSLIFRSGSKSFQFKSQYTVSQNSLELVLVKNVWVEGQVRVSRG
jgi:hypothetical protein